jgi:hypothetical protein
VRRVFAVGNLERHQQEIEAQRTCGTLNYGDSPSALDWLAPAIVLNQRA